MPRLIIQVDYCSSKEETEQNGIMIWTKGNKSLTGGCIVKLDYSTTKIKLFDWIWGLVGG